MLYDHNITLYTNLKLIFLKKNIKNSNFSTQNNQNRDSNLINTFHKLFQIEPDLFQVLIFDKLLLDISIN